MLPSPLLSLRRAFQLSMQLRRLALALGLGLLGASCAKSHEPAESAWAEAHYPSYPSPAQGKADPSLTPAGSKGEPVEQEAPGVAAAGSPLRQKYEGARALRTLKGKATYYGDSLAGNKTANGDRYDPKKFSAAHRTLRFGTIVRVIRTDTGQSTYVRINDRGPFGNKDRIIDLSRAAATELAMIRAGVVSVRVEIVEDPPNS
jgi:rare lipoprotein A